MFNSNCASVPLVASVDGNNNGMFGGDGWWAIIIFALIFGWGGNGFGGFGGFGGNRNGFVEPCATQADVRAAVDQQTLISKLDQQTYGLADSTYALNNTINQNFRGVDNAICNRFRYSCADVSQFFQIGVHLCRKAGNRRPCECLIAGAARKLQNHIIIKFHDIASLI